MIGENVRARLDYARAAAALLSFQGQPAAAAETLALAAQTAADLDLPGARWQILASLGHAQRAAGEPAAAAAALEEAETIALGLAQTLPDGQARQTFLQGARRQLKENGT